MTPEPQTLDPEDIQKTFGATLRQFRLRAGYSQEGLADAAGLDRTYIGSVERGERNLSLVNIVRIARTLQIPPTDLLAKL